MVVVAGVVVVVVVVVAVCGPRCWHDATRCITVNVMATPTVGVQPKPQLRTVGVVERKAARGQITDGGGGQERVNHEQDVWRQERERVRASCVVGVPNHTCALWCARH